MAAPRLAAQNFVSLCKTEKIKIPPNNASPRFGSHPHRSPELRRSNPYQAPAMLENSLTNAWAPPPLTQSSTRPHTTPTFSHQRPDADRRCLRSAVRKSLSHRIDTMMHVIAWNTGGSAPGLAGGSTRRHYLNPQLYPNETPPIYYQDTTSNSTNPRLSFPQRPTVPRVNPDQQWMVFSSSHAMTHQAGPARAFTQSRPLSQTHHAMVAPRPSLHVPLYTYGQDCGCTFPDSSYSAGREPGSRPAHPQPYP
jgi:hypothetical protein